MATRRLVQGARAGLAASIMALASACATLSEEECMLGDWRGIGFEDGAAGQTSGQLARHRDACAKVGVSPDLESWRLGYEDGLRQFCTIENALAIGLRGGGYNGVCTGPIGPSFAAAYQDAYAVHKVESALSAARSEQYSIHERMEDLRADIRDLEYRSTDVNLPLEERRAAGDELAQAYSDLRRAKADRDYTNSDLFELEAELEARRAVIRANFPGWPGW